METDEARARLPLKVLERINFTDSCWFWTGTHTGGGGRYGVMTVGYLPEDLRARFFTKQYQSGKYRAFRPLSVHRFSYEFFVGPIPDGLEVHHRCKTPECMRPDHLELLTHAENIRLSYPAMKTHCANGHVYDNENTHRSKSGGRVCRACNRANQKRFSDKQIKTLVVPVPLWDLNAPSIKYDNSLPAETNDA